MRDGVRQSCPAGFSVSFEPSFRHLPFVRAGQNPLWVIPVVFALGCSGLLLSALCLHFVCTFSALVDATPDLARKFGPPFRPLLFGTPASRLRFPHFGDQGRSIPKAFHVDLKPLSPYAVRFVLNPGVQHVNRESGK